MGTSLGKGNIWSVTVFAPPTVQHCEVPIKKTLAGRGPLLPPLLQLHHLQDQGLWQVELCLSLELPPPGWAHSGATTATTLLGTLGHWSSAMQTTHRCCMFQYTLLRTNLWSRSQVWNAFTDEGSIKKAVLRSHLDCQGGLPQNTLAKSALKILDCQGGQPEEYLGQEQGYVEYVPEV